MQTENAIEEAALQAIRAARRDGATKYGPDSWMGESVWNQLDHINALLGNVRQGNEEEDHLGHLLCRAAIAVALRIAERPLLDGKCNNPDCEHEGSCCGPQGEHHSPLYEASPMAVRTETRN